MTLRVLLGPCIVVLLALSGCDTPAARARLCPGTYAALSPADRRLVLAGQVRAGMSTTAVFIAWGEPDAKRSAHEGKDQRETWLYRRQLTLKPAMDSFDRWLPGNGLYGQAGTSLGRGGFGFGGLGTEGARLYPPHLLTPEDTVRRAEFEGGRLTTYELYQAGTPPLR